MRGIILCLNFSLSILSGYSQPNTLKGIVYGSNDKLEYCNLIIYSLDSIYINGYTCFNGEIDIKHNYSGDHLIHITSLGYQDHWQNVSLTEESNLDAVVLKNAEIESVIVTASRPVIEQKQGKYTVNVSGTQLQHLPTINDILKRAPTVISKSDGIEVMGRGIPLIYIDGRPVKEFAEVEMLQPNEIESVTVDRNPSAKYSADVASVIQIKTKRNKLDGFSSQVYNKSLIARKYSNITGVRINHKINKVRNYFAYDYTNLDNKDYVDSYETNYTSADVINNILNDTHNYDRRSHDLIWGVGFELSDKSDLSFQYNLSRSKRNSTNNGDQKVYHNDVLDEEYSVASHLDRTNTTNIISGLYLYTPNEHTKINILGDYLWLRQNSDQNITEILKSDSSTDFIDVYNKSTSDAFSLKFEFEYSKNTVDFLLGARVGHIDSKLFSLLNEQRDNDTETKNNNKITDNNYALYFTFGQDFDAFGYEIGVRNENVKYTAKQNNNTLRDKWDVNFFPSVNIYSDEGLSDNLSLSLNYTSSIERPSFRQLDPAVQYFTNLSYSIGNPLLKSTINHNVSLEGELWSKITLSASYDYYKNPILLTGVNDVDNSEIIVFKPININKSREWDFCLSYNDQWNWYKLGLDGGVSIPNVKIPYLGETKTMNRKCYYFQINNDIKISNNTFVSASFNYNSKFTDLMTEYTPTYDLGASVTQYLFKRRITLNLAVNDILRKSYSNWHDKYGYVSSGQRHSMDSRYFSFTVRFNFNNYMNVYRRKSNSDQEAKRLR